MSYVRLLQRPDAFLRCADYSRFMRHDLARFLEFSSLNRSELDRVARQSRRIAVPAGRWLLRPGRVLQGHHFLLRGTVMTLHPDRVVAAGGEIARRALYPGIAGLRTLSDCELLQVSAALLELLRPQSDPDLIVVGEAEDCWQTRLLGSELMARMRPAAWQAVLSRLTPVSHRAGEVVIVEGERDVSRCFILTRGRAQVEQAGAQLARIEPGGLFGEDALITRAPRNASVRMLSDGASMAMRASDFQQFLSDVLLQGAYQPPDTRTAALTQATAPRVHIRLCTSRNLRQRIALLDRQVEYLVSSPQAEVVALAIFLMRTQGLQVWAAPGG